MTVPRWVGRSERKECRSDSKACGRHDGSEVGVPGRGSALLALDTPEHIEGSGAGTHVRRLSTRSFSCQRLRREIVDPLRR